MPPRKRTSSMLNGDAKDLPHEPVGTTTPDDVLALAEEAEAEAAEAEATAAAARARARAIRLRRQAAAAAAVPAAEAAHVAAAETTAEQPEIDDAGPAEVEEAAAVEPDEPAVPDSEGGDTDDLGDDVEDFDEAVAAEPKRRRQFILPGVKVLAAALVVLLSLGSLGAGGWMVWHHQQAAAEQQRSAEFAAAARQGVVTLMSLDYTRADEDVKRILDNTTGDFRKDFEGQATDFADVAKQSKVTTQATINSTAVQTMTKDTATVLVAVTTNVSNAASKQQEPRSWRLRVDVARDGGQIKLARVEFVP